MSTKESEFFVCGDGGGLNTTILYPSGTTLEVPAGVTLVCIDVTGGGAGGFSDAGSIGGSGGDSSIAAGASGWTVTALGADTITMRTPNTPNGGLNGSGTGKAPGGQHLTNICKVVVPGETLTITIGAAGTKNAGGLSNGGAGYAVIRYTI